MAKNKKNEASAVAVSDIDTPEVEIQEADTPAENIDNTNVSETTAETSVETADDKSTDIIDDDIINSIAAAAENGEDYQVSIDNEINIDENNVVSEVDYEEEIAPRRGRYSVMSSWNIILSWIFMSVPVIGWLFAIIWAACGCKNLNRRHLARAWLVLNIGLCSLLIIAFIFYCLFFLNVPLAQVYERIITAFNYLFM